MTPEQMAAEAANEKQSAATEAQARYHELMKRAIAGEGLARADVDPILAAVGYDYDRFIGDKNALVARIALQAEHDRLPSLKAERTSLQELHTAEEGGERLPLAGARR